ncbi:hypothetical protein ACH4TP_38205 [Streptomyces sp. NPDC021012]|uniref:hypothetical protein n=1 Tax=Streptomyces sp. NPDC021012 TaxID=3365107 RepID=UPI00379F2E18
MNEEFEQGRRAPFTMLGDWVAVSGIAPDARSMYWDVKAHVNENRGTGAAWPPRDFLALLAGDKQARTMDPYMRQLEAINAIGAERERSIAKMRSRNLYKVHDTPPRDWDGPSSHAEVWEWLRQDREACVEYYVDRKAWLKDIETAWTEVKKEEKAQGAKASAPVSKAGHRAWLKECQRLWAERRRGKPSSPRSAVQRTTENPAEKADPDGTPDNGDARDSGSAVQRTTQCGTAHPGSAVQRTGTTSKGNNKKEQASPTRSVVDGRSPSTSGSSAREVESGSAASGNTKPAPSKTTGSQKARHSRDELATVDQVLAFLPPQIPSSKVRIPAVADAILAAMREDGRSVEEMGQRINARWADHGFADKATAGTLENPVGAVIAMVRPLRRGDRYACADIRCEDGRNLDTDEACRLCEVRAADWKAAQQRKRAVAGAQDDRRDPAPAMPSQRAAGAPVRPIMEDCSGPYCSRSIPAGTGPLCGDCLEQQEAEAVGAALAEEWAVEEVHAAEIEQEDAERAAREEAEAVARAAAEAEHRRLAAEEDARLRAEFARQNPDLAAFSSQGPAPF